MLREARRPEFKDRKTGALNLQNCLAAGVGKRLCGRRLRSLFLMAMLACAWRPSAQADLTPVRHLEGTIHGFLEMRSEDGRVVATGDSIQVAHGERVTTETIFHFNDGSIDDEITVFSQRRNFQLITYHRNQKGAYFPHPMDLLIDFRSGQVTVRSTEKDGKEKVETDHLHLPPDLANGMVPLVVANMPSGAQQTTVSMLVATPKPRVVKLDISNVGEETFSVAGSPRKAIHDEIKIELGGLAGVVAPMIGKQPPNIEIWIVGGQAPTFLKERGPIYPEGPMMTIQLVSPDWPNSPKP